MKFQELNLKQEILDALEDKGFEEATEIQQKAIPLLSGNKQDFVGQAQTGTGKTAAFVLPLLNNINTDSRDVQALILAPTRELANQVCEEIKEFSKYQRVKSLSVYGGTSIDRQIGALKRLRPQIVVGTPGRVLDLINRGVLRLENATQAILDEADEMLDMGFIEDVKTILAQLGDNKNTWMFSATMPKAILDLIKTYLNEPEVVRIEKKNLTNDNIEQKYYLVRRQDMTEALCRVLDVTEDYYSIIFCRTKVDAKNLTDALVARGMAADSLHGDMSQQQRDITMRNFKNKKVNLLVCTDVAARGIDVDHLSHVFNYGLPQDIESYVHRIGRTGRAGSKGIAASFIEPGERYKLRQIEDKTKAKVKLTTLPTIDELKSSLVERELKGFDPIFENLEQNDNLDSSFETFEDNFSHLEKDELLRVMFSYIFQKKIQRYEEAPKLDADTRRNERGERGERRARETNPGFVRYYINIGRDHGLDIHAFLRNLSKGVELQERNIRRVELKGTFSFFEVPEQFAPSVEGCKPFEISNTTVKIEKTKSAGFSGGRSDRGGFRGRRDGGRRDFKGRSGDNNGNRRNFNSNHRSSDRGGFRNSRRDGNSFGNSRKFE